MSKRDKELLIEATLLLIEQDIVLEKFKYRWKKLKEYINSLKEFDIDEANTAHKILEKMGELEKW